MQQRTSCLNFYFESPSLCNLNQRTMTKSGVKTQFQITWLERDWEQEEHLGKRPFIPIPLWETGGLSKLI